MSRTQLKTFVELLDFFEVEFFMFYLYLLKKKKESKRKKKGQKVPTRKQSPKPDNKNKPLCTFYLSLILVLATV